MSEKGLTLKKLLMILFILGIIGIAVFYYFNASKKTEETSFVSDVQNLIVYARETYAADTFFLDEHSCYHSKTNPVSVILNDKKLQYYVKVNETGEVTDLVVKSEKFELTASDEKIRESQIGSSSSDRKFKATSVKKETVIPSCN